MSGLINAIVGAITLLFGRQLFWLFVAVAGFVLGFNLAGEFLNEENEFLVLAIAVVAGVVGAVLGVVAQRVAVAIAGFIAGAYLALYLAQLFGLDGERVLVIIIYIAGGVAGSVLVSAVLDPALIILSSALGATLLMQSAQMMFDLAPSARALVFIALLIIGIAVQWSALRREELHASYHRYEP